MTVRRIVEGNPHEVQTIGPAATIGEAVAALTERRIGAMPVVADGQVVGIFSERDVIRCLSKFGSDALVQPVRAGMTSDIIDTSLDEPVMGALSLMTKRRIRHLPVIENGGLAGFVSIGDLVKYRIEKIEAEAEAMRHYIQNA